MTGGVPPEASSPKNRAGWKSWIRKIFYRRDGGKYTANKVTVLLLGTGVLTLVYFLASRKPVDDESSSSASSVEQNIDSSQGLLISMPETAQGLRRHNLDQKSKESPKPLAKLSVISRSNALEVPPGSMFKAKLLSGGTNGPLRAVVTEALQIGGEEKIPVGAILVGVGQSTEERLMVSFNHLVFKDGSFTSFKGQACDWSDQMVGLKGSKVGHYAQRVAAAAALNFIAGAAEGLQEETLHRGIAIKKPTPRNAALQGTKRAAFEQGSETMAELKSKPPIIEVPANTNLWILVSGD